MEARVALFVALAGCVGPQNQAAPRSASRAAGPPDAVEPYSVDGQPGAATRDGMLALPSSPCVPTRLDLPCVNHPRSSAFPVQTMPYGEPGTLTAAP